VNFDPLAAALGFGVLLISLTIHEAAHAWTADRLGDPTARMLGRVSLNPLVHIDWVGTVLLPLLAMFSGLLLIGWAKPVPVNTRNLRHPRRDFMLVAAAGPISNLLQALAAAFILRGTVATGAAPTLGVTFLTQFVFTNLALAFFNLIPVPPLDGGNVALGLMPPRLAASYAQLRSYGFLILYVLMLTGVARAIMLPPTIFLARILLP
jgi:Zn-dependent protease